MWGAAAWLMAFGLSPVRAIDPAHAQRLAVYHSHPLGFPLAPVNQNTADFAGHVHFDIYSTYIQFACTIVHLPGLCGNPEIEARDLVVTELVLEVDNRWDAYGKCNICTAGHDPFEPSIKCRTGEYTCNCEDWPMDKTVHTPCGLGVGRDSTGSMAPNASCQGTPHFVCWLAALGGKHLDGFWYSTLEGGQCRDAADTNCTWRMVEAVQRINKTCHDDIILSAVEQSNPACFRGCTARSVTSPCWMDCYVRTVLGPDASTTGQPGGLPREEVLEIWRRPFRDPGHGGCPRLSIPPSVEGPSRPSLLTIQ